MELMEQAMAVMAVMALLAALLWWLRGRAAVRWPRAGAPRRLQLVERLPLTQHHSLHVVKTPERTMLIAVSPHGCALLDKWETRDGGL